MKPSKTVMLQQAIKGTVYRYTKTGKDFEIWKCLDYVCLLCYDPHLRKWSATHNVTPTIGDKKLFRFTNPLEAIENWGKQ